MIEERRTLYHFPLCPFCRKVRLVLFEKEMPCGLIYQEPWRRTPEFLAMNPLGDLPVLLESEGYMLSNHNAITEYLNEIKPLPNLMGETPRARAEIRRISSWFDSDFYRDVYRPLVGERVIKALQTQEAPNATMIRAGRENLREYLGYIEWLAARRPYLGGKNLSMADLTVAAHLSTIDYLGEVPWDDFSEAKLWYMKIKSRPAFSSLLLDKIAAIMPAESYTVLDF